MAQLAVFDIDGTLTDTNAVDDECYRAGIAALLQSDADAVEWQTAPHITDAGIARWLWQRTYERDPTLEELSAIRDRFLEQLSTNARIAPGRFAPIPGAAAAITHLRANGWAVALATGGWSQSARLKLRAAQIEVDSIALASSDDASVRVDIVRAAVSRAAVLASAPVVRVVTVGDAPWDVLCARELGYAFVGIGAGERAAVLRDAGASVVLPDYRDLQRLTAALETATVPAPDAPAD
jgi:phosphoglycolate phosphatase-like HAD superfamily hydrolase